MPALRRSVVGVRSQAIIVMVLTGLWYVSCAYGIGHIKGRSSDFWSAALVLSLPIALLFAAILWWSYFRSDRTHSAWVAAATVVLLSPLILSLLIYALY